MTGPRDQSAASSRADARRNRDRILEAGAALLAVDPQAGLAEIAAAAGVSRATVYRHFPDVESLRAALQEEAEEVGRDLLREHLPPMLNADSGSVVQELLDLIVAALPMEHRWTKVMAAAPDPYAEFIEAFAPVGRALIKRGQARGEFRSDLEPDLVFEGMLTLVMLAVRKVHGEGMAPDRALEVMRVYVDGMTPSARR